MKNRFIKFLLIFVVFSILTGCTKNIEPVKDEREIKTELKELGYSSDDIEDLSNLLSEENLSIITEYDYIDNLVDLVNNENFIPKNLRKYIESYSVTNNITDSLIIINNNISYPYNVKLSQFMNSKYFILSRLDRYMSYDDSNTLFDDIVEIVNTDRDYEYYTHVNNVDLTKDKLMLVNKYNRLSIDYKNEQMVRMSNKYSSNNRNYLDDEAYNYFKQMHDDASKEGLNFVAKSAYISYEDQEKIYNDSIREGNENITAKAGFSEHQTGLSVDIMSKKESIFKNSKEYQWLRDNANKYGFILRYPENKENITGYSYESGHFRYVGVDVATYIYENKITFDEYYAYFVLK